MLKWRGSPRRVAGFTIGDRVRVLPRGPWRTAGETGTVVGPCGADMYEVDVLLDKNVGTSAGVDCFYADELVQINDEREAER